MTNISGRDIVMLGFFGCIAAITITGAIVSTKREIADIELQKAVLTKPEN